MQWEEFRFTVGHLSEADQATIERAFILGAKAHEEQKRKSGEPYFTHPIGVAQILIKMGADRDTIVAALLHDTVEDTALSLVEIEKTFGPAVARIIDGLTKLETADLERPALNKQIETLRKMFTLMQQDVRIMVIKLADRLHNMQTLSFVPLEKQVRIARETTEVYAKIADRFSMRDMRIALESLALSVLEPELFAILDDLRKQNEIAAHEKASAIQLDLQNAFPNLHLQVRGDTQTWEKLRALRAKVEGGQTVGRNVTVILVCQSVADCYSTLGALHQLWLREALTFDDFINAPVVNGYKGLHTTVILPDGTRVRCKIRTEEMEAYAHRGITMHCFAGTSGNVLDFLQWTRDAADLAKNTQSRSDEFWDSLQSDIMQESIPIYDPSGASTLVPLGSTVLDGAFFQHRASANYLTRIRMNGMDVQQSEPLVPAATLEVDMSPHRTVRREWMANVETGLAISLIRQGLGKQDRSQKVHIGRDILEHYLSSTHSTYLAELQPEKLDRLLQMRGMLPLDDTSVLLAEGRLTPDEVGKALFTESKRTSSDNAKSKRYVVLCDVKQMQRQMLLEMIEQYLPEKVSMTYDVEAQLVHCRFVVRLTQAQRRELVSAFKDSLRCPHIIRSAFSPYMLGISTGIVIALWGIDPVFASMLLKHPELTSIDLHIIRFFTLTMLSGGAYAWTHSRQTVPEAPLTLTKPSFWASVGLLFLVSFLSYLTLKYTLPSHYSIPMTAAGLFVTSIVNRKNIVRLLLMWILAAGGIVYLVLGTPDWRPIDIIWTLLTVASFTGFSIVSEQYKRTERISARVAQYFFFLSVFCTLLSIPLLPFSSLFDISPRLFAMTVAFCVLCTAIPYYIYYTLLTHREIDFILRFSFLIIPVTIVAQILTGTGVSSNTLIAALIVMIGAALPLALNKLNGQQA